ncbi:MAG TPA: CAP domain-containing protein [Devosiaceae bacterium]|nr:CAP domain-containing protein [Devosiaceae bacterium]
MTTRRQFMFVVAAGLGSALLSGCTLFGSADFELVRVSDREAAAAINAIRARNGLGSLTHSRSLQVIASQQARWMAEADRLAHEVRADLGLAGRIARAGYQGIAGENISAGYTSLASVIDGWMASPEHRHNMLGPDFTEFGIAAARVGPGRQSRYGVYWALVLGAPATARVNPGLA